MLDEKQKENKRLTDTELERIRTDIRKEHQSPKTAVDRNSEGIVDITEEVFAALYTPENSVKNSIHPEPTEQKRKILDMKHQIVEKWEEIKSIEIGKRVKLAIRSKNRKARELIVISNKAISEIKKQRQLDMKKINKLVYATAAFLKESRGIILKKQKKSGRSQPVWKKRIEEEITRMQGDLAMLTELTKDNGIRDRKKRKILRRLAIKDEGDIDVEKERLKRKIQGKAQTV